jgi:hypothetical protein
MNTRPAAVTQPRPPTPETTEVLAALGGLRQLAGQLQGLEQAHTQSLLKLQETDTTGATSSAAPDPAAESLQRLRHRLESAMEDRRGCQAERTSRERDLEEIERKLEKKQQRLDSLLASQAHESTTTSSSQTSPLRAPALPSPAPDRPPASAQTKEAKARLAALERQLGVLDKQLMNVLRPRVDAAKAAVQKQHEAVGTLLGSKGVRQVLYPEMRADRLALCQRFNLPDVFSEVHGDRSPPFEQYLDRFTELDSTGTRQLRPDLLQDGQCGTALATLCEAATCSVGTLHPLSAALAPEEPQAGLLGRLVTGGPAEVGKLLEEAVSRGLSRIMKIELPALIRDGANLPGGRARRQEMVRRSIVREAAQRAETLLPLLQRHRDEAQSSLIARATPIVAILASDYRGQAAAVETLQRQVDARRQDMRANLTAAQEIRAQCTAARAMLQAARETDRANRVAAPPASASALPARAGAVTVTVPASIGPDLEARIFKLRGEIAGLTEQRTKAQNLLNTAVDADKSADQKERKAQAAYDTAVAAHGRAQDSARRAHEEARERRAAQRDEQARLASQVTEARNALTNHPALARLLEPDEALKRAIERHVTPGDAEQHQRARHETGYAATYQSLGHLVEAACDVYEDAVRHCPGLFAARSRAEFDAAAALLKTEGKSTVDRVFEHRRAGPIARGYSSALDQTAHPVPVNESCYSLRWQEGSEKGGGSQGGRVLVSHLYPYVPHRQFRTLEP